MEAAPRSYFDRLEAGIGFQWRALPARQFNASNVDRNAETVLLHRERASHRGVGRLSQIRTLLAYEVNQAFFDEVCELSGLETLYMQRLTASDLRGIGRLRSLQRLVINSATRISDLSWVESLPATTWAVAIEHAPTVRSLDPLASATRLKTLAVEGSLHSTMRVESLAPLAGLAGLQSLFLTALKTDDKRLSPLAALTGLKLLEFANYYAPGEVAALAKQLPRTRCSWFEKLARAPADASDT